MKQVLLLLFSLTTFFPLKAQNGSLSGKVLDAKTGEELVGAAVMIDETTIGSVTNFMGEYIIPDIAPGTYTIKCQYISYEPQLQQNIKITAGNTTTLNFNLSSAELDLEEVNVVAKANRENENMLLMEQKKSVTFSESIGAQQLATQGVSDASAAIGKITGVSQQTSSQVIFVRGLGDRYNTTTLNGLPLPGNHAEYKNIDLELFPTDVIGYVAANKTFNSSLYGDVGGANINIASKNHTGESYFKINLAGGYNSNASGVNQLKLQDGPGFWGYDNFKHPAGEYVPVKGESSYFNFDNGWDPGQKNVNPNLDFGLNGGRKFHIGEQSSLSLFATASFNNKYNYQDIDESKSDSHGREEKDFSGEKYSYKAESNAMLNLVFSTSRSDIYLNSLLLNVADNNLKQLIGQYKDISDLGSSQAVVRRSNYERNTIIVNQLLGKHKIGQQSSLNWGFASNQVSNILPDRHHNIFVQGLSTGNYVAGSNDAANNHRYWHDLKEDELAANIVFEKGFGAVDEDNNPKGKFGIGYSGRYKTRKFESLQYNHKIYRDNYQDLIDPNNVDAYFNNNRFQQGAYTITSFFGILNLPNTYSGEQIINAGIASLEYQITPRLGTLIGLRGEQIFQNVDYKTTISTGSNDFNEFKLLPSVSFKYESSEKSNIRLAASHTYTLPQFKEKAPMQFEGITYSSIGNPYLQLSTIYNADLKWELYPNTGELISIAGFGKYIKNPINHFVMSSASNDFTYANTGDWAYIVGAELVVNKDLWTISTDGKSQKISTIGNLSLMHTEQELNNDKVSNETEGKYISSFNKQREELQGAAPLIANATLTYNNKWNDGKKSATVSFVYAYTSEKLYLLGYAGKIGNQYDNALNKLDFILKSKWNQFEVSMTAKNILDEKEERYQRNDNGDVVVQSFKSGIDFKIGISYKF